jgi:hypothetical protein
MQRCQPADVSQQNRAREHPFRVVGVQPRPFLLVSGQRCRLVPDVHRDRHPPEVVHEGGSSYGDHVAARESAPGGGLRGQVGHRARMTRCVQRLEVREVGHHLEIAVEFIPVQDNPRAGLGFDHVVPYARRRQALQIVRRVPAQCVHDRRVVAAPGALPGHGQDGCVPSRVVERGGVVRHVHDASGEWDGLTPRPAGESLAVPAFEDVPQAMLGYLVEAQAFGEESRHLAMSRRSLAKPTGPAATSRTVLAARAGIDSPPMVRAIADIDCDMLALHERRRHARATSSSSKNDAPACDSAVQPANRNNASAYVCRRADSGTPNDRASRISTRQPGMACSSGWPSQGRPPARGRQPALRGAPRPAMATTRVHHPAGTFVPRRRPGRTLGTLDPRGRP